MMGSARSFAIGRISKSTRDAILSILSIAAVAALEIQFEFGEKFFKWGVRHEAHWTYVIPGGESYAQASRRAREWFRMRTAPLVTIIVTHAKMSRVLRGAYLELPPSTALALKYPQDRIFASRRWTVETIRCVPPDEDLRMAAPWLT